MMFKKCVASSITSLVHKQVKVYMGEGWHSDFHRTHFDRFSPPDFFVRVSQQKVHSYICRFLMSGKFYDDTID